MKVNIGSKDKLVQTIEQVKLSFKDKYKETPVYVLLNKKDFITISAWMSDHKTNKVKGMKPLLDQSVTTPFVGGTV